MQPQLQRSASESPGAAVYVPRRDGELSPYLNLHMAHVLDPRTANREPPA